MRALRAAEAVDDTDHALVALVLASAAALDRELVRAAEPDAKSYTLAPSQRVYLAALTELDKRTRVRTEIPETLDDLLARMKDLDGMAASDPIPADRERLVTFQPDRY